MDGIHVWPIWQRRGGVIRSMAGWEITENGASPSITQYYDWSQDVWLPEG